MMVLQPLAYQSVAMLKLIIIHVPYSTNIAGRNPWQNAAQNTFGKKHWWIGCCAEFNEVYFDITILCKLSIHYDLFVYIV